MAFQLYVFIELLFFFFEGGGEGVSAHVLSAVVGFKLVRWSLSLFDVVGFLHPSRIQKVEPGYVLGPWIRQVYYMLKEFQQSVDDCHKVLDFNPRPDAFPELAADRICGVLKSPQTPICKKGRQP